MSGFSWVSQRRRSYGCRSVILHMAARELGTEDKEDLATRLKPGLLPHPCPPLDGMVMRSWRHQCRPGSPTAPLFRQGHRKKGARGSEKFRCGNSRVQIRCGRTWKPALHLSFFEISSPANATGPVNSCGDGGPSLLARRKGPGLAGPA
jgi:hypothetical protein